MTVTIAIDIEKAGPLLTDKIVSIGYAIQADEDMIFECFPPKHGKMTKLVCERMSNVAVEWPVGPDLFGDFEEQTWNEFWVKQDIRQFKFGTMDLKTALEVMIADIKRCARDDKDFVILSDNPSFDIACIDYFLGTELGMKPLRYLFGSYADVLNPMDILIGDEKKFELYKSKCKMTHNPREDANVILDIYNKCIRR